jgi:hypothetical protein
MSELIQPPSRFMRRREARLDAQHSGNNNWQRPMSIGINSRANVNDVCIRPQSFSLLLSVAVVVLSEGGGHRSGHSGDGLEENDSRQRLRLRQLAERVAGHPVHERTRERWRESKEKQ